MLYVTSELLQKMIEQNYLQIQIANLKWKYMGENGFCDISKEPNGFFKFYFFVLS